MPRARFELTIPVFERSKIIRATEHTAIGTGSIIIYPTKFACIYSTDYDLIKENAQGD